MAPLAALALTAGALQAQDLVIDGDFGPNTAYNNNSGATYDTDADEGWHFPGNHRWDVDYTNGVAYVASLSGAKGLTQVIRDDYATTGFQELTLLLANTEGDSNGNVFLVQIYGVNGPFTMGNWNSNPPTGEDVAVIFESGNLAGESFPNSEFFLYPDFGEGYEFIAIRIVNEQVDPAAGDAMELDDIRIIPATTEPVEVEISAVDNDTGEAWPEPGAFVVRRTGNNGQLTVPFADQGTAILGTDYTLHPVAAFDAEGNELETSINWLQVGPRNLIFPNGVTELVFQLKPKSDSLDEGSAPEIAELMLLDGQGYQLNAAKDADFVQIWDAATPSREEAVRFLLQASYGPGISWQNGQYRDDIEIVQNLGFEGWIDWQFSQPVYRLTEIYDNLIDIGGYSDGIKTKQPTFFHAALGYDAPEDPENPFPRAGYSPLRQKMAYALSQILVISEKSTLGNAARGMMHYYDEALLRNAFGNYRDVLLDVTYHPTMGIYLSHLRNRQATFDGEVELTSPDENYAREILQLFSIGTLELNNDGSPKTVLVDDGEGNQVEAAISSYDNDEIVEFARIFTGLTYSTASNFNTQNGDMASFMKAIDWETLWGTPRFYHDTDPKTLLQRSPRNKTLGDSSALLVEGGTPMGLPSATNSDIEAGIDNIFYHPNVGPFLAKLLIQRFTFSNPKPWYVSNVAGAFNNTGGVRGDLKAVAKRILLHGSVRNYWVVNDANSGALREPWMRLLHLARTFKIKPEGDGFIKAYYVDRHLSQRPFAAPSVFNFYLPGYTPPDPDAIAADLVGPEFQISSGGKLIAQLDFLVNSTKQGINGFSGGSKYDFTELMPLADDPDHLIRELDLKLCHGRLNDYERKIIIDAARKVGTTVLTNLSGDDLRRARIETAIGLVVLTPSFSMMR